MAAPVVKVQGVQVVPASRPVEHVQRTVRVEGDICYGPAPVGPFSVPAPVIGSMVINTGVLSGAGRSAAA